nr:hypothetical protein [Prolixibacteraceae bacterium]
MKYFSILFNLALIILLVSGCKKDNDISKEETIQVSGIEFIPNVFLDNEEVVGIDADIAAEAMQNAGIDMELSMA